MSTTTAKPRPRRMRIASEAILIPQAQFRQWHDLAVQTPGLAELDRRVLGAIREWYRRLYVEQFEGALSYERMARRLDVDSVGVRWAVERLVALGLIGVVRGSGARPNHYMPALPKRLVASMSAAAADDGLPRF